MKIFRCLHIGLFVFFKRKSSLALSLGKATKDIPLVDFSSYELSKSRSAHDAHAWPEEAVCRSF